jgi:dTDP-glucose pyrophosphorylase
MHRIDKIEISKNAPIREALTKISAGALRIALVIENNLLLGTITDGDIRSALLDGLTLDDSIESLYNRNPIVCYENEDNELIIEKAIKKKIYQIPIVNRKNEIVGIEDINELLRPKIKKNTVIIMAGGMGTRLRPLTENTPKPMLKVGTKPILHTIIENFKKYGFLKFILCVNYKSDVIVNYFGDGSAFGIELEYVYEEERMGTAGALSLLNKHPKEAFFVMNGDLLTNINFEHLLDFHSKHHSIATMGVREYEYEIPYGVVNVEKDAIKSIVEKPRQNYYVNAGIYVLTPKIFDYIPKNQFFDMPSLFNLLIEENNRCSSYLIEDYWLDIGRIGDYEKANIEYHNVFKK